MKKESTKKSGKLRAKAALLLAAVMLLPMFAAGCESAQDIIKKRERADEVGKLAEAYMQKKYNRGFKVRKNESAEGEEYNEGDYFITFNSGVHAFYDSAEDMFYDDRQADIINEAIMRDIWIPMFQELNVMTENLNDWSQTFNMVYHYERGGKDNKFSMYNKPYDSNIRHFAVSTPISVHTGNIILIAKSRRDCSGFYDKLRKNVNMYFKAQKKGSMNVYAITEELHARADFKADEISEATEGCLSHFYFGEREYCSQNHYSKVTDGFYGSVCHVNSMVLGAGDITLVPVEDFEATKKSIVESMDSKEIGFLDQYTAKKRDIDFEGVIYKVGISNKINQKNWKSVGLAFLMKDSDAPIEQYAEMNEKERSFFAYNLNGTEYNATCLCSQNSRSVVFDYNVGDEVYFWFGTQK